MEPYGALGGTVWEPGPYRISVFWFYFSFVFFWLVALSCSLVPVFIYFLVLAASFPSPLHRAILCLVCCQAALVCVWLLVDLHSPHCSRGGPDTVW